jgi:2-polyprenyl-6-methoxyphenol hydroxylase-like FAD-dependent oxidoreductase
MRNDRGTGTAVVIGASMAGLGAARVLSERFGSVTVLDRDKLPEDNTPRRGVPQGSHGHILLVSGLRELATLFDGLEEELLAAGGTRFDPGLGMRVYQYGRRSPTAPAGLEMIAMSRPLLEGVIRNRVAKLAGVTIRDQVAVTGLASAGGRVTGVVLDSGETLAADRGLLGPQQPLGPLAGRPGPAGARAGGGQGRGLVLHPDVPAAAR